MLRARSLSVSNLFATRKNVEDNEKIKSLSGTLWKMKRCKTIVVPQWNKRWFTIEGLQFKWYENEDAQLSSGAIELKTVSSIDTVKSSAGNTICFIVTCSSRQLILRAASQSDRDKWIRALMFQTDLAKGGDGTGFIFNSNFKCRAHAIKRGKSTNLSLEDKLGETLQLLNELEKRTIGTTVQDDFSDFYNQAFGETDDDDDNNDDDDGDDVHRKDDLASTGSDHICGSSTDSDDVDINEYLHLSKIPGLAHSLSKDTSDKTTNNEINELQMQQSVQTPHSRQAASPNHESRASLKPNLGTTRRDYTLYDCDDDTDSLLFSLPAVPPRHAKNKSLAEPRQQLSIATQSKHQDEQTSYDEAIPEIDLHNVITRSRIPSRRSRRRQSIGKEVASSTRL